MNDNLLRVVLKTVTSQVFGYPGLSAAHQMLEPWPHDPSKKSIILPLKNSTRQLVNKVQNIKYFVGNKLANKQTKKTSRYSSI